MRKVGKSPFLTASTFLPEDDLFQDADAIKFELYLRSRELKEISFHLEKIILKNSEERKTWMEENRKVLESLLKVFADGSNLSLNGIDLDEETTKLSMEFAVNLRQTVAIINALFYNSDGLVG